MLRLPASAGGQWANPASMRSMGKPYVSLQAGAGKGLCHPWRRQVVVQISSSRRQMQARQSHVPPALLDMRPQTLNGLGLGFRV